MKLPLDIKAYLAAIGRKGGAARSPAKTKAARENARKGGRPKKEPKTQPEDWSTPEGRRKVYAKYDWIDRTPRPKKETSK